MNFNISREQLSHFRKQMYLNRCFFPDCTEKAIKAHSLQRNGILSFLAGSIKGQKEVYYLDDEFETSEKIIQSIQKAKRKLYSNGIAAASTFNGFCQNHDGDLFKKTIEDTNFRGTAEQCFYHTYRTFAHRLHKDYEILMTLQKGGNLIENLNVAIKGSNIAGIIESFKNMLPEDQLKKIPGWGTAKNISQHQDLLNMVYEDYNKVINLRLAGEVVKKTKLDFAVREKQFDVFQYHVRTVDGTFPFACASVLQFLETNMRSSEDGIAHAPDYAITVLPEWVSNKTHFIIAAFPSNPNVALMMSVLNIKENKEFLKFMSDVLLARGNNMYLSPRMYDLMTSGEREVLINSRINVNKQDIGTPRIDFNLFDSKFLEVLGN